MKRIDRLVYKELIGPWVFGVALFTALIFATVLLVRITDWVVKGVSATTVTTIIALLIPGIVVKTFGMALLLSSLLAFGRLSNDSEIVALKASGTSLFRMMRPVLFFGLAVAALAFAINETVVPSAASRATALTTEIKKELSESSGTKPVFYSVPGKNGVAALINAADFSLVEQALSGVTIVTFDERGKQQWILLIDRLHYEGERNWRIEGAGRLISADGSWIADIVEGAWPKEVERPRFTPQNLLAGFADDLDVFSLREIAEEIESQRKNPHGNPRQIANLEFGMYNKIAIPLGAVVFALLGAPLGIRNVRAGLGTGFAVSIVLSFAYLMLANLLAVYSKGGALPPWLASFAPVIVGMIAAGIAIAKKNV